MPREEGERTVRTVWLGKKEPEGREQISPSERRRSKKVGGVAHKVRYDKQVSKQHSKSKGDGGGGYMMMIDDSVVTMMMP